MTSVVPAPDRVGQGTAIEQSRAAAEALGDIEAAQRWPRDVENCQAALAASCGRLAVAEKAAYSYPIKDSGKVKTITGPSVYLARQMVLAWGHVHYGIAELRRDDTYGQSEVMSWAKDLQSGVKSSRIFILPHQWFTETAKEGKRPKKLIDLREIQFNNLSVGGRNVRETMLGVMPGWFLEEALHMCTQTLIYGELNKDGSRKASPPLPQRRDRLVTLFWDRYKVNEQQLTRYVGSPPIKWSIHDVVGLERVGRSISDGEVTVAAMFPAPVLTGAEIIAAAPQDHATAAPARVQATSDTT